MRNALRMLSALTIAAVLLTTAATADDLPKLLELLHGVSLLIGHRKDMVGVARFFNGSIEQINDVPNPFSGKNERITYIVPKFYWMKKHSKATAQLNAIWLSVTKRAMEYLLITKKQQNGFSSPLNKEI